jgi:hypothetical protein
VGGLITLSEHDNDCGKYFNEGLFKMRSLISKNWVSIINITIASICLYTLNGYAMQVSFFVGDVFVYRNGKSLQPEVNMKLLSGDLVVTNKGGMIVLAYGDGNQINVQEKSKIRIGSERLKDSESVSILAGVVNGKFKKLLKGSESKVYTPTTVCSVRGTDFLVGVSDSADSRIDLKKGKLELRNPYGKIEINQKEKADIGVADIPKKDRSDSKTLDQWKVEKDEELDKNPRERGEKFDNYLNRFKNRSSMAAKDIDGFDSRLQKGNMLQKKKLEKSCSDLNNLSEEVEEDMFLNEAASSSIDGILNRFQKDKQDMYDIFLKIKEESNRVLEQQRRNYEALKAVREAYRKAYDEIMGKHKDYMNQIRKDFKRESVKPDK